MIQEKTISELRGAEAAEPASGMRWTVLSLLFVATTINYLDRGILGVILPEIRQRFNFGLEVYGTIQFVFQIAYGVGSLICGKLLDRYGTRIGYGIAAAVWSAAAVLNAFAGSAMQFGLYRTALGLGESANFPACNKAAAEWFPPRQRATAMGVVNFGTNFAQIIGPPIFIWIALQFGWQACFAIMGVLGFLWLPVWLMVYRLPKPKQSGHGRSAVAQVQEGSKLSIRAVLKYKQAWGYGLAKFLTDGPWWFYLFWLPTYLNDVRHFTPGERGSALSFVYAVSGVGAVAGGVFSSYLMKRGWQVGKARKTVMLLCAILMPLGGLGVAAPSARLAVLLFAFATFAHQAWMTNLFTTPADVFPRQAVGSANGFGVALGAWGGALFSALIPGYVIPIVGYLPVLMTMSCFYLIAWVIVHKLMGNLEMVKLEEVTR
jgi:ACS family hexuronate transporter-like MFS transporter